MERFFKIKDEEFINRCKKYERDSEEMRKCFIIVSEEFGIETHQYFESTWSLVIEPTEKDREKFGKYINGDQHTFRKNSKMAKRWLQLLEENDITTCNKPSYLSYTNACRYSSRLFKHEDEYYGSISAAYDFTIPTTFIEMPGSEFYKILEKDSE